MPAEQIQIDESELGRRRGADAFDGSIVGFVNAGKGFVA
jgi:hypothetical protein